MEDRSKPQLPEPDPQPPERSAVETVVTIARVALDLPRMLFALVAYAAILGVAGFFFWRLLFG